MNSSGRCETGLVRKDNQDSIFIYNTRYGCLPNIYIVADGMGGHKAGEVASISAIKSFCDYIHDKREVKMNSETEILDVLVEGVKYSNSKVFEQSLSNSDFSGMGTTFVIATCFSNKVFVLNIGDSRLYLLRGDVFSQITHDHTYVMELVRKGKISKEEANSHPNRNVLLRALGTSPDVEVDAHTIDFFPCDIILMCSDGLTTMLSDMEIKSVLTKNISIEDKASILIKEAIDKGGNDNISVILVEE